MSKDTRLRELLANVMPSLVKDFPASRDLTPPEMPRVLTANVSDASSGSGEKRPPVVTVKQSKAKNKPVMVSNVRGIRHVVPLHCPVLVFSLEQ
jgi:hypothetical protein